jgi:hypothetical protein
MSKPHTDKFAKPEAASKRKTGKPSRLITVLDAKIRCAMVSGTFLLYEEHDSHPYLYRGNTVIDVDCSWYQWRAKRNCVRLILRNGEEPFDSLNEDDEYFTNIERP